MIAGKSLKQQNAWRWWFRHLATFVQSVTLP